MQEVSFRIHLATKGIIPEKITGVLDKCKVGLYPFATTAKKRDISRLIVEKRSLMKLTMATFVGNKRQRPSEAKPFEKKQWVRIHDPRSGNFIRTDKASFQRDHAKARLAIDEQATAQLCVNDQEEQYDSNNEEDDTEDIELEEDFVLDDYTAQEE
jgi:hypothetical protein